MRFFLVILTIMSLLCGDIFRILLLNTAQAEEREESPQFGEREGLFLVRIISIDIDNRQLTLELLDKKEIELNNNPIDNQDYNSKNQDIKIENFIYNFDQYPSESFKQGDIIRIWGTIDNRTTLDNKASQSDDTGKKTFITPIIKGKIAGLSNKNLGDDPTGVRKRLKRRLLIHQPFRRGTMRGQP